MAGQDAVAEARARSARPGLHALDVRGRGRAPSRRPARPVRVGPGGVLARRRARRVGDASAGPAAGTAAPGAAAAIARDAATHLVLAAADVNGAGAARLGVGPRDRPVERPVDLERRGPVAVAASAPAAYQPGSSSPASRASARGITSAITIGAATRSPPAQADAGDAAARGDDRVTARAGADLAAEARAGSDDQRVGQRARAALAGSASRRRGRAGSGRAPRSREPARVRAACRRASPRRTATPRAPSSREQPRAERRRPSSSSSRAKLQRAARARRAGEQRRPAHRREAGEHRRAHRREGVQERLRERPPALAVAGAQRLEARGRARPGRGTAPRRRRSGSGCAEQPRDAPTPARASASGIRANTGDAAPAG